MPVPVGLSLAAQHNRNHLWVCVWLCICIWVWAFIALSIRCWPVPASNNHPRFDHYKRSSFGICYVHTPTDTHNQTKTHKESVRGSVAGISITKRLAFPGRMAGSKQNPEQTFHSIRATNKTYHHRYDTLISPWVVEDGVLPSSLLPCPSC